jgi:hypothetical protein
LHTPPAILSTWLANDAVHDPVLRYRFAPRFPQCLQRVVAVISLVGDRFPRAFRLYPFAHFFFVVGRARNLSAMCSPACGNVSRIVVVGRDDQR